MRLLALSLLQKLRIKCTPDWSDIFECSVGAALAAIESGKVNLPPCGVICKSRSKSEKEGADVYFFIRSTANSVLTAQSGAGQVRVCECTPFPARTHVTMMCSKWQVQFADLPWCAVCGVQFNFWLRRDHCRLCGKTVCSKCGPMQVLEGLLMQTPICVCGACSHQHEVGQETVASMVQTPLLWDNSRLLNVRCLDGDDEESTDEEEERDGFLSISLPTISRASASHAYLRNSVAFFTSRELEAVQKAFRKASLDDGTRIGWPGFTRALMALGYGDDPETHKLFEEQFQQVDRDEDGACSVCTDWGTRSHAPPLHNFGIDVPKYVQSFSIMSFFTCLHPQPFKRIPELAGVPGGQFLSDADDRHPLPEGSRRGAGGLKPRRAPPSTPGQPSSGANRHQSIRRCSRHD